MAEPTALERHQRVKRTATIAVMAGAGGLVLLFVAIWAGQLANTPQALPVTAYVPPSVPVYVPTVVPPRAAPQPVAMHCGVAVYVELNRERRPLLPPGIDCETSIRAERNTILVYDVNSKPPIRFVPDQSTTAPPGFKGYALASQEDTAGGWVYLCPKEKPNWRDGECR